MQDAIAGDPPAETPALPLRPDFGDRSLFPSGNAGGPAPTLADQAKRKLTGALADRKNAAADLVEELANTVGRSGEQFQGQQWIASAVDRGAAELHTLAGSLRQQEVDDLTEQLLAFARRRPALFAGAALATGFAVARLGKVTAGDLSRDDLPTLSEAGHGQH